MNLVTKKHYYWCTFENLKRLGFLNYSSETQSTHHKFEPAILACYAKHFTCHAKQTNKYHQLDETKTMYYLTRLTNKNSMTQQRNKRTFI